MVRCGDIWCSILNENWIFWGEERKLKIKKGLGKEERKKSWGKKKKGRKEKWRGSGGKGKGEGERRKGSRKRKGRMGYRW